MAGTPIKARTDKQPRSHRYCWPNVLELLLSEGILYLCAGALVDWTLEHDEAESLGRCFQRRIVVRVLNVLVVNHFRRFGTRICPIVDAS